MKWSSFLLVAIAAVAALVGAQTPPIAAGRLEVRRS